MPSLDAGYVVVDLWRAKPGKEDELKRVLTQARRRFRAYPGIISVDYAHLDGDDDVDTTDLDILLGCFSGADVHANMACAALYPQ